MAATYTSMLLPCANMLPPAPQRRRAPAFDIQLIILGDMSSIYLFSFGVVPISPCAASAGQSFQLLVSLRSLQCSFGVQREIDDAVFRVIEVFGLTIFCD